MAFGSFGGGGMTGIIGGDPNGDGSGTYPNAFGGVGSLFPSAPQLPSAGSQMKSIYKMVGGQEFAQSLGFKNMKSAIKEKGLAYVQEQLQNKWGPVFEQQQLESLRRTAPEYNQLQLEQAQKFEAPMLMAQMGAQKQASPEFFQMRDQLAASLMGKIGQGLSPEDTAYFQQQMNQQQAAKGMYDSPLGSTQTARYLTGMNLQQQQQNEQNAQGFLNSFRLFPTQDIGVQGAGQNSLISGPSFSDLTSLQSGTMAANNAANIHRLDSIANFGGSMMGMFGGGMGGGGGG